MEWFWLAFWANLLRCFQFYTAGDTFGPMLMSKVFLHVFFLKSSLCVTSCTLLSLQRGRVWRMVKTYVETYGHFFDNPHERKRVKIALAICITVVASTTGYFITLSIIDGRRLLGHLYFPDDMSGFPPTVAPTFVCIISFYSSVA